MGTVIARLGTSAAVGSSISAISGIRMATMGILMLTAGGLGGGCGVLVDMKRAFNGTIVFFAFKCVTLTARAYNAKACAPRMAAPIRTRDGISRASTPVSRGDFGRHHARSKSCCKCERFSVVVAPPRLHTGRISGRAIACRAHQVVPVCRD